MIYCSSPSETFYALQPVIKTLERPISVLLKLEVIMNAGLASRNSQVVVASCHRSQYVADTTRHGSLDQGRLTISVAGAFGVHKSLRHRRRLTSPSTSILEMRFIILVPIAFFISFAGGHDFTPAVDLSSLEKSSSRANASDTLYCEHVCLVLERYTQWAF